MEDPRTPLEYHYIESEGLRYITNLGSTGGNIGETMILVSVGNEFPSSTALN